MRYRYQLTTETIDEVKSWTSSSWIKIIESLLSNETIPYNIDFSQPLGYMRVIEMSTLLDRYSIRKENFFKAAYRLFQESLRSANLEKTYQLVQLFDYTKPAVYFDNFVHIILSKEYEEVLNVSPSGDFSLKYWLINAIFIHDVDNLIINHLLEKSSVQQPPEYYLVMVRCIYTNNPELLNNFLQKILAIHLDDEQLKFLSVAFKEHIYTTDDFGLMYGWLVKELLYEYELRKGHTPSAIRLLALFVEWVNEEGAQLSKFKKYAETIALLSPFNTATHYDIPINLLVEIFESDNSRNKNKLRLCEYIGFANYKMQLVRAEDDGAVLYIPNEKEPLYLDLGNFNIKMAVANFLSGINKSVQVPKVLEKKKSRNELEIDDAYIAESQNL